MTKRQFDPPVILRIGDGLRFKPESRPRGLAAGVRDPHAWVRAIRIVDFDGVAVTIEDAHHGQFLWWIAWRDLGPDGNTTIIRPPVHGSEPPAP